MNICAIEYARPTMETAIETMQCHVQETLALLGPAQLIDRPLGRQIRNATSRTRVAERERGVDGAEGSAMAGEG